MCALFLYCNSGINSTYFIADTKQLCAKYETLLFGPAIHSGAFGPGRLYLPGFSLPLTCQELIKTIMSQCI